MANHQARSFVPALPGLAAKLDPAPFSAAVLKRLRNNVSAIRPSNSTLDKVARYNLVQFLSAAEIVDFINVAVSTADKLDPAKAVANFDCKIEGIGTAVAYLHKVNGQHLPLVASLSAVMNLAEETVEQIFQGRLFPEPIAQRCVEAMTLQFGIKHLKVARANAADHSPALPTADVVQDCLKLLI